MELMTDFRLRCKINLKNRNTVGLKSDSTFVELIGQNIVEIPN